MKKESILNIKYFSIQILYFGIYVALMGYASVYLIGKGYSNSQIGITLAISGLLAFFIQALVSTFSDKNKQIELRKIVIIFLILMAIMSIGILFIKSGTIILLCLFIGIATIHATLMPLLNAMAFIFEKKGIEINYGLGRGLGSAAYATISLILGYLVKDFGVNIFPIFYLIFNILLILFVQKFVIPINNKKNIQAKNIKEHQRQLTFLTFCKKYKKYTIFVIGLIFVYFTHMLISNFFIQIISPIGGTESQMGTAIFISAIVELPAMYSFNYLRKKIRCSNLIRFAVVIFAIKHILILYSKNITMIYIAETLQMLSYAILIPACVYYANQVIGEYDAVKGQALLTMAFTASNIIASIIGGILLDKITVHNVLMICAGISIIGILIVEFSIEKTKISK